MFRGEQAIKNIITSKTGEHTTLEWDGRGATLVVPVLRTYLLTPRRHYPITPVLPTPVVGCLSQHTSQPKGEGAEA